MGVFVIFASGFCKLSTQKFIAIYHRGKFTVQIGKANLMHKLAVIACAVHAHTVKSRRAVRHHKHIKAKIARHW